MTTEEFLGRAARYLESAGLLLDHGDVPSAVSRAYYAMFFAAEAALMSKKLAFSSHKGVIAAFGEQYIKTGIFPMSMGRELARAHDKRLHGDYDADPGISREDAAQMLRAASTFVARIQERLDAATG